MPFMCFLQEFPELLMKGRLQYLTEPDCAACGRMLPRLRRPGQQRQLRAPATGTA